jgi:hypothetical protein
MSQTSVNVRPHWPWAIAVVLKPAEQIPARRETHNMMLNHYRQTKNVMVSHDPKATGSIDVTLETEDGDY